MDVEMPANGWRPRPHQRKLWQHFKGRDGKTFDGTGKRAIEIAHRRWGKDDVALHLTAQSSVSRVGTYWHLLPQYEQARKAIWNAVNPHTGRRRIDEAFPKEWRANTNEHEMFIRFKWGSTWQVIGSDNYQSLVGTPPVGIVLSEWAKAHPGAWAYLAPILIENKGWALAITTPEGRNHAAKMYEMARQDAGWFAELQTIEDSIRLNEAAGFKPSITLTDVEAQRREYHTIFDAESGDALIQQEYYCSFAAAILGAFWGKQLEKAEREGRICELDLVKGYPVNRAWDIGIDDPMAIWCFQVGPGWLHIIDYIEGSGQGFDFYADQLRERGYLENKRGIDYVPHDAKQREPGAPDGRTRIQTMFTSRSTASTPAAGFCRAAGSTPAAARRAWRYCAHTSRSGIRRTASSRKRSNMTGPHTEAMPSATSPSPSSSRRSGPRKRNSRASLPGPSPSTTCFVQRNPGAFGSDIPWQTALHSTAPAKLLTIWPGKP
jgi:phage terminase large subunit